MKNNMETKMITIPFEVELAKEIQTGTKPGKIVTRDGKDARVVCWDRQDDTYPIVVLFWNKERSNEFCKTYRNNGCFLENGEENKYDLTLQVPEWTQFKDGDVLTCEVDCGGGEYYKWFSILKGEVELMFDNINFNSYVSYDHETSYNAGELTYDEHADNIDTIRLATEEEKQKLIKRLQEEDTDKAKGILTRFFGIEEKQECEFEFLQPVLVRANPSYQWLYGNFTHMSGELHLVSGGIGYKYCIPYNEQTKHLLGTTEDWEEQQ